jgi:hypothetical protein
MRLHEMHAGMYFDSVFYNCQILTKPEICWDVLVRFSNTKFHENLFTGSQFVI